MAGPDDVLRPESSEDLDRIRELHRACFPTPGEARLVDELRTAGRLSLSLVALSQDRIVGHVAFSPVTVAAASSGVGLAPVAVLSEFRRRGIADRLIRRGLADCAGSGHRFAVVLGDPAYYGRFGFRPASEWGLLDEYGGGDAFGALELVAGSIPAGAGLLRYAPEFAGLAE